MSLLSEYPVDPVNPVQTLVLALGEQDRAFCFA